LKIAKVANYCLTLNRDYRKVLPTTEGRDAPALTRSGARGP
jgi:hypothetical protein